MVQQVVIYDLPRAQLIRFRVCARISKKKRFITFLPFLYVVSDLLLQAIKHSAKKERKSRVTETKRKGVHRVSLLSVSATGLTSV